VPKTHPRTPVVLEDGSQRPLSVEEAAARVGVTPNHIKRSIRSGDLRAMKLNRLIRVHPDDLAAYLAAARGR